jgi:hypothetical protein
VQILFAIRKVKGGNILKDRRYDIPLGCIVNLHIINDIKFSEDFITSCIEIPEKMNIKPPREGEQWPFFNLSWGSYMMYCFLVVPYELYKNNIDKEYIEKLIIEDDIIKDFDIKKFNKDFKKNPFCFFTFLRNSIAHVSYTINDNDIIRFWNDKDWDVEIKHKKMIEFLGKFGDKIILRLLKDSK